MTSKSRSKWYLNSFFSGIGGFELAFERQGFSIAFNCENDPFCRSVLERHWPHVEYARDILKLDPSKIPSAHVWTAGFPCQDLSLAKVPHGRSGFRGKKSSLFFTFHQLLQVHRPEIVVLENVAGLLNAHRGADFRALLVALTELGYAVSWRLLNARYFGVPQSRARVFICAWMNDPVRAVSTLFENKLAAVPKREREGFITTSRCSTTNAVVPHVSYCISATSARHTGLDWARSYVTYEYGVRRLTPLECERIQGFPELWSIPGNGWVTPIEGIDTERYRALGNAIAVPVGEWIAKRIRSILNRRRSHEIQMSLPHTPLTSEILCELSGEFAKTNTHTQRLHENGELKWQRGGCAFGDVVIHTAASTAPRHPIHSRFVDLLEKRPVHHRYFLSPNAARGILRRVDRIGRHLFPPLDAKLRSMAVNATAGTDQDRNNLTCKEAVYS